MVSFLCIFGTENKFGLTTSICTPKQVKYCSCKVTPIQLYSFEAVESSLSQNMPTPKSRYPPPQYACSGNCPMGELDSSSSPLCSMGNQVAGLHRHFQSEQRHILCVNHSDSENSMKHNRAPTKSAAVQKKHAPEPLCTPYA